MQINWWLHQLGCRRKCRLRHLNPLFPRLVRQRQLLQLVHLWVHVLQLRMVELAPHPPHRSRIMCFRMLAPVQGAHSCCHPLPLVILPPSLCSNLFGDYFPGDFNYFKGLVQLQVIESNSSSSSSFILPPVPGLSGNNGPSFSYNIPNGVVGTPGSQQSQLSTVRVTIFTKAILLSGKLWVPSAVEQQYTIRVAVVSFYGPTWIDRDTFWHSLRKCVLKCTRDIRHDMQISVREATHRI